MYKEENGEYYYAATKCKGRFEFHDLALHKNKSFAVIPKAIYNYFVKGIDPETTLVENTNIFDYCAGKKIKGDWKFYAESIENGEHKIEDLQKTIRYYVANTGSKIIKYNYTDGRKTHLEAGEWMQKLFITAERKEKFYDYDINYSFYMHKIMSEINKLEPKQDQLKLSF